MHQFYLLKSVLVKIVFYISFSRNLCICHLFYFYMFICFSITKFELSSIEEKHSFRDYDWKSDIFCLHAVALLYLVSNSWLLFPDSLSGFRCESIELIGSHAPFQMDEISPRMASKSKIQRKICILFMSCCFFIVTFCFLPNNCPTNHDGKR